MRIPTPREDLVETIHGVRVSDPYRWLEDEGGEEVRDWVEAQNALTRRALDALPGRARLRERLSLYLSVGTLGTPSERGGRVFHLRREGSTNQPILHVREGAGGRDRPLVDPNTLSPDGTVALDWWHPSLEGDLLAYGLSSGGSELSVLRIRDVATGRDLPDEIPGTRACSVAWEPGGQAFYYTRYPSPGSVPAGEEMYHRHVFRHRLGADPAGDERVFGEGREPDAWPVVALSSDGRWLLVAESHGWVRTNVYLKDLRGRGPFVPLVEGPEALYEALVLPDRVLLHTNDGASSYRVFSVDPEAPARESWREIVPPADEILQSIQVAGDKVMASYLDDAASRLRVFGLDGRPEGEIELPGPGTIYGMDGRRESAEFYFGFVSFATPPRVYRHDAAKGTTELWDAIQSPVRPEDYEVVRTRYESKDGTRVPVFIVMKKGLPRDGSNPLLLTGYGGFNISLTPNFERDRFVWLERGGILAIACLRGGGEYGEAWHRAGMLDKKQNVFDDFIAAAEYCIREGYTRPDRLAIAGGSNGGLLIGAAITQRPDLFRAAVCAVPLLDMIRYHRFQIARLWIHEYGSADDAEQFEWLRAYSPYHKVEEGARYPATLLMTAESDSRVDPMHARKMAARLQAAQAEGGPPILLRVETKAGHGAGKPLAKQLDAQTDIWSFLYTQIGWEG